MAKKDGRNEDFKMKNEYWEFEIEKADYQTVKIVLKFFDKKIPLREMEKLEESIRRILEACARLEALQPSKRQ